MERERRPGTCPRHVSNTGTDSEMADYGKRAVAGTREIRGSDSALVAKITRVTCIGTARKVAEPSGTWHLRIRRRRGTPLLIQSGQIDGPFVLDYQPGDTYLAIAFKPDVFMPRLPGSRMVNREVLRPLAARNTLWIDRERFEIPTFENADQFVADLVSRGVIVRDPVVRRAVDEGLKRLDDRTLQRHFVHVTGMTGKALQQVLRANQAARLLESGYGIAAAASMLGYTDQSHMTNSLRRILGRTPGQIAREAR